MPLTPNWFASVMGTGIVANALVLLPHQAPGQRAVALAFWAGALALLATLAAVATARGIRIERGDPFLGAPPMALLTVAAGTLLVGRDVLGEPAAVVMATPLWLVGTVLGLATAIDAARRPTSGAPEPAALMPVVPPMVSAAAGAGLAPHLGGVAHVVVLAVSGVCFAVTAALAAPLLLRIARDRPALPAARVPTLLIVLGPLGQSATAAGLLVGGGLAVAYGAVVLAAAALWLAVAGREIAATMRDGLPFAPTWWAFTFPVGTCVTGLSVIGAGWAAVALFALLACGWIAAAAGSLRHVAVQARRVPRLA